MHKKISIFIIFLIILNTSVGRPSAESAGDSPPNTLTMRVQRIRQMVQGIAEEAEADFQMMQGQQGIAAFAVFLLGHVNGGVLRVDEDFLSSLCDQRVGQVTLDQLRSAIERANGNPSNASGMEELRAATPASAHDAVLDGHSGQMDPTG